MLNKSAKAAFLIGCAAVVMGFFSVEASATTISDSYCKMGELKRSARHTLLIIDGSSIEPEKPGAPAEANRDWRRFAISYADATRPQISSNMAPRELLTLAVANADGSGVTLLFQGCVPFYSESEKERLAQDSAGAMGAVSAFFGGGWRAAQASAAEEFLEDFELSLVQGVSELSQRSAGSMSDGVKFVESGLISSLAQSSLVDLKKGLPRVIVYGDFDKFRYANGDVGEARRTGRQDAEQVGLNLRGSEIHLFGLGNASSSRGNSNYLESFFLSSKGLVETLTSSTGSLNSNRIPSRVQFYQGTSEYPDGKYPTRLRLVRDSGNAVFNSWIEVQSDRTRFVPFEGILECTGGNRCQYNGDRVFAQIWSDNPDPSPEFEQWMPFAGFRNFEFEINGKNLIGFVSDSGSTLVGSKNDRMNLDLKEVDNAAF